MFSTVGDASPPSYLIWVDLEMTGLDPQQDVILEMATTITDNELRIIAHGPSFVLHQPESALAIMDPWCVKQHSESGLIAQVASSTISVAHAEQATYNFLTTYCAPKSAILAGNSVFQDRAFIIKYMPSLMHFLHYRIIDVSTVKELARRWYPNNPRIFFKKKDTHRAQTDIEESIRELQHYREHFFKPVTNSRGQE